MGSWDDMGHNKPQSNQRGIETPGGSLGLALLALRLNRTSVGLKPMVVGKGRDICVGPQSNQRGIETETGSFILYVILNASIEPAWD